MGRWQVVRLGMVAALGLVALGCDPGDDPAAKEDAGAGDDAAVDTGAPPGDAFVPYMDAADDAGEDAAQSPVPCVTELDCDDGVECTVDTCEDDFCQHAPDHDACEDDGNDCTLAVCGASGCGAGPVSAGTPCSAGYCDGEGTCLECLENAHCSDGNLCTADVCIGGVCVNHPFGHCDDGNPCTANWYDDALGCQSTTVVCDDADECTADVCNPAFGCEHPALEDGTPCSYGQCQRGACVDPTGPTAKRVFRMDSLVLADPHVVFNRAVSVTFLPCTLCRDISHAQATQVCSVPFGEWSYVVTFGAINPALLTLMGEDGTDDGNFDLSHMLVMDPYVQTDGKGGRLLAALGSCLATDPTACAPEGSSDPTQTSYRNRGTGVCLASSESALGPLGQVPLNAPANGCFVSGQLDFQVMLPIRVLFEYREFGGVVASHETGGTLEVPLQHARISGEWVGAPATSVAEGLVVGFLPMRHADQLEVTVDGHPDADQPPVRVNLGRDLLPDGGNAHGCGCVQRTFPDGRAVGSNAHCLGGDSRDLFNPDADASYDNCGWWFYLNFTGTFVENAEGF
jgi:hypothetical protein